MSLKLSLLKKSGEEEKHEAEVETGLVFNKNFFSGSNDGIIKIWSLDLTFLGEFKAHDYAITHLTGDSSKGILYTASVDSSIKEWKKEGNGEKWILSRIIGNHGDLSIRRLRISGEILFSADENGNVKLWKDGIFKGELNLVEEIWEFLVWNEGRQLVTVRDKSIVIYDIALKENGKLLWNVKTNINGSGPLLQNNGKMYHFDRSGMILQSFDFENTKKVEQFVVEEGEGHSMIVNGLEMIQIGGKFYLVSGGWDGKVILWDVENMKKVTQIELGIGALSSLSVESESGRIFASGENGIVAAVKIN